MTSESSTGPQDDAVDGGRAKVDQQDGGPGSHTGGDGGDTDDAASGGVSGGKGNATDQALADPLESDGGVDDDADAVGG